ncbi:MAG: sugar transferase [Syntrophaceae bacterium]|nr:sugar transferase [Syntrophaceae bacterium]
MFNRMGLSLRESSPFLMKLLRLIDSSIVAALLYPIVMIYIGFWAEQYARLSILSFVLSLLVFHTWELYRPWRGQNYLIEFRAILGAWVSMASIILFLLFAFKEAATYSRVVLVAWFLMTPLSLFIFHGVARGLLRSARSKGKNVRTAIIVGAGELGISVATYIREIPWAGIRIVGFFDDFKTTEDLKKNGQSGKPVLGILTELPIYLREHPVDLLYITLPMRLEEKIQDILYSCRTLGARIYLVPDLYVFKSFNSRIERLGNMLLLGFNPDSKKKRVFDVCFSLMVLFISLPLILCVALLIKLQDRGPVFYGHPRVAVAGKWFDCLKFRTMHVNADKRLEEILRNDPQAKAEWDKYFKLKNDPRVTWIGRFLRKTSLDELPQFINVLKGDMSVVGARPIVYRELHDYYKENGGLYCSIKPGITGIWQVSTRNDTEDYQERVRMDVWYALNRNFWLDMKIILQTVGRMFTGKGAY